MGLVGPDGKLIDAGHRFKPNLPSAFAGPAELYPQLDDFVVTIVRQLIRPFQQDRRRPP